MHARGMEQQGVNQDIKSVFTFRDFSKGNMYLFFWSLLQKYGII